MLNFKKLSLLLLLVVLVFTLTGCGSSEKSVQATISKYFEAYRTESKQGIADVLDLTFNYKLNIDGTIYTFSRDNYLSMMDSLFINIEYHSLDVKFSSTTVTSDVASASVLTTEDYTYKGQRGVHLFTHQFTLMKRGGKWYITGLEE